MGLNISGRVIDKNYENNIAELESVIGQTLIFEKGETDTQSEEISTEQTKQKQPSSLNLSFLKKACLQTQNDTASHHCSWQILPEKSIDFNFTAYYLSCKVQGTDQTTIEQIIKLHSIQILRLQFAVHIFQFRIKCRAIFSNERFFEKTKNRHIQFFSARTRR